MKSKMIRSFFVDGDFCEITFVYDRVLDKYFGEYPDFEEEPKYTTSGKKWVNVFTDACPYAEGWDTEEECLDCGSCKYLLRERDGDLIGVCTHKKTRIQAIDQAVKKDDRT